MKHVVVGVARGAAVIYGVTVTETTEDHKRFEPAKRYLLLGLACRDGRFVLNTTNESVVEVSPLGALRPPFGNEPWGLVEDLLGFGTLARLDAHIAHAGPVGGRARLQ